jgi:hypothetical protein
MKERMIIEKKEIEGRTFYFKNFGREYHGKSSFQLWINLKLVNFENEKGEPYIEFPCENAKIIRTEKENLVLRPCEGWYVFKVGVECGYRGESSFEILEPQGCEVFKFQEYHSPAGNLGISTYGLINSPFSKIKIKWKRTGRLYGKPATGVTIFYADGEEENLPGLKDGLEALEEIKKLTQE